MPDWVPPYLGRERKNEKSETNPLFPFMLVIIMAKINGTVGLDLNLIIREELLIFGRLLLIREKTCIRELINCPDSLA